MNNEDKFGQRVLASVSLLLMVLILFCVALFPYVQLFETRSEASIQNDLLSSLNRQIKRIKELKENDKLLGKLGSNKSLMLEGETTGIAGANLQKQLTALVAKNRGRAISFQVLPPKPEENMTKIPINFSLDIDIVGLQNILFAIETGQPLIFVDNLVIRSINKQNINPYSQVRLNVTVQVSGYFAKDKKV